MEKRRDFGSLLDTLLTVVTIAVLILSVLNRDALLLIVARFWKYWSVVLRTVAYASGRSALEAEAAYWRVIETVRK